MSERHFNVRTVYGDHASMIKRGFRHECKTESAAIAQFVRWFNRGSGGIEIVAFAHRSSEHNVSDSAPSSEVEEQENQHVAVLA